MNKAELEHIYEGQPVGAPTQKKVLAPWGKFLRLPQLWCLGVQHGMANIVFDGKALGQAQHGSAPDIAGRDIANPVSPILSASMLLDWMSTEYKKPALADSAKSISEAVELALANSATRTRDLGGSLGTQAFADVVVNAIRKEGKG